MFWISSGINDQIGIEPKTSRCFLVSAEHHMLRMAARNEP